MAQIKKKAIADDAIADEKIKLDQGDWLRSTDGGAGTVDILRVDASNRVEINYGYQPKWVKLSYSYTDFNSTGNTYFSISIGDPEADRSILHAAFIKTTTSFAGTGTASADLGTASNPSAYIATYNLLPAPAASNNYLYTGVVWMPSNALQVTVNVDTQVSDLSDGAFDLWLLWSILPA